MGFLGRVRGGLRTVIFWTALFGVLGSAVALGANRPVSWTALWAVSAALFALLIVVDLLDRQAALAWRRVLPSLLLWTGVMVWGVIQAGPAPLADWAHPAWVDAFNIGALDGAVRQAWPWDLPAEGAAIASISADPAATFDGVMRLSTYLMLFWIGARGATDRNARNAVKAVALFSIALALYGLIALFAGYNPLTGSQFYTDSVTASFVNKNAYALYAAFGAMACIAALALHLPTPRRGDGDGNAGQALRDMLEALVQGGWIWLVGFAVTMAAMLYTVSRAGAVAGLLGIGLMLVLTLGRASATWRWGLLVLLLAPAAVMSLGAGGLFDRLTLRDPGQDGRIALFEQIVGAIEIRPWLGHGLGAFQDAFRVYTPYDLAVGEWELGHNTYLENAFELGLPATAALLLAVLLIMVRLGIGIGTRRRQRPIPALALAMLVAGGLHALVDFSMQMPATAALAAYMTGLAWTQTRREAVAEPRAKPIQQGHRAAARALNKRHPIILTATRTNDRQSM